MSRLIGVGVGPGDPELVTVKAVRVLREADVVLVPVLAASAEPGRAETIIRAYVAADRVRRLEFALNETGGVTPRRAAAWQAAAAAVADEFACEAEAGADDGAVQAAGRVQAVPEDGGRGAGGGADLVADDGSAAGQRLVQDAEGAVERSERDRFGALGQRYAGPGGQVLHGGDARHRLHRHLGTSSRTAWAR